jgi:hypothetical protein
MVSDVFCEISCTHVLVLEELCCSEEQVCSLVCLELFATVEEEYDASEQGAASPGVDRRFVEDAGVLENRNFIVRIQLIVLFVRHRVYRRKEERRGERLGSCLVSKVGPSHHGYQRHERVG